MSVPPTEAPATSTQQPQIVPPTPPEAGTERFDDLIQVVRPWMKLALAVSVVTIVGALLWAMLATISTSVTAVGGVVPTKGFVTIAGVAPGILEDMNLKEGDVVKAGQRVGQITGADGSVDVLTSPVDGTVAVVFYSVNSEVPALATILLIAAQGDQRSVVTFLLAEEAASVSVGQQAVFDYVDCPPFTGTVSAVLRTPLTMEQIAARLQLAGLAEVIAPPEGGVGVEVVVGDTWCPTIPYAATGDLVITTGSVHPISYLQP